MSYIGNTPAENYASFLTETFSVSATANYTLSHAVSNENDIRLVINNVVQQPGSGKAYTASGTTLTLTSATSSGDVMYAVYLGRALQTVNPPNASVGSAQVADSLISGKTALGATPADTDELLISDAGTLKRVDYSYLKSANTPAFFAYKTSETGISSGTVTKVTFNTELYDTNSNYDNSSNYRFTPTVAGKYTFSVAVRCNGNSGTVRYINVFIRKNGGTGANGFGGYTKENNTDDNINSGGAYATVSYDMNGSSDYVEGYVQCHATNPTITYDNNGYTTYFSGYKIIE